MSLSRENYPGLNRTQFNTLIAAFRLHSWWMKVVVLCYKRGKAITMLPVEVSQKLFSMGILMRLDKDRLWVSEKYEEAIGQTSVSELMRVYPEVRSTPIVEVADVAERTSINSPPISGVQMIGSTYEEEVQQLQTA